GRANRARLLVLRAQALRLLNRPGEARETAARALAEAAAAGERWDEADAARVCSLLARDVADLAAAERHGGRAVELWEQIGDIAETAGALSLLGVVAADRGDLNGAHRLYQRSLTAFRAAHDPLGEAHVLWRL